VRFFLDTNVIVYALDQGAPAKQKLATDWLAALAAQGAIVISPQVLNETVAVLVHKLKVAPAAVGTTVRGMESWCTAPLDVATAVDAVQLRERYGFNWWDCLILASALAVPCDCLLTEDLQDGQNLGRLQIINPFLHPVESVLGPS
jgi:predicted nucleic acid-binding protein